MAKGKRTPGLGAGFDMFARPPRTPAAEKPVKKGPVPRRTLNVPVELGERIADAAEYHDRKVSSLVIELLIQGLDELAAAEAEKLGQPGFEYPRRAKKV